MYVGMFGGKRKSRYPLGLSVDSDSNIIVADTGNKLMGRALLLFLSTVLRVSMG